MENKQKIKSDEIDLIGLVQKVWNSRWFLIKFSFVFFILGIVIAFSIPKEYRGESKIVSEETKETKTNQGGSFASLLGLNVNNGLNAKVPAELYPEILQSTPYLIELANIKIQPEGLHEMSLFEYIVRYQKEAWWQSVLGLPRIIIGLFSEKEVWHNDTVWDTFKLTRQQRQFINSLSEKIHVKNEQETGLITIHVFMQDPMVAAVVTDNVVRKLHSYIASYQQEKAKKEMSFVKEMYEESQKMYSQTKQRFNEFSKGGVSENTPVSTQVDVDLTFGFFNMMAQQYEMLKVDLMKQRPIFSVIEPATIPLNAAAPRKTLILLLSLAVGVFVGIIWIFIKDAFVK